MSGPASVVSFKCTACGKCCNSPPLLTAAELFYHQDWFVGGLAIRRLRRMKAGEVLSGGGISRVAGAADAAESAAYAGEHLFTAGAADFDFALLTQGLDYESLARCPALGDDNRCLLHERRKPVVCSVAPFDAMRPDSFQALVLLNRNFLEDCIAAGPRADYEPVADARGVLDADYAAALRRRRADLALEKHAWGETVYGMLRQEGFWRSPLVARLALDNGVYCLSIVPVLMALAAASDACARRCIDYAERQIALLEQKIDLALQRKQPADKAMTQLFRTFKQQLGGFALDAGRGNLPRLTYSAEKAALIEEYLLEVSG